MCTWPLKLMQALQHTPQMLSMLLRRLAEHQNVSQVHSVTGKAYIAVCVISSRPFKVHGAMQCPMIQCIREMLLSSNLKETRQLIAKPVLRVPAHSPSLVTLSSERFRTTNSSAKGAQDSDPGIWIHILVCWHTCQTVVIACQQC